MNTKVSAGIARIISARVAIIAIKFSKTALFGWDMDKSTGVVEANGFTAEVFIGDELLAIGVAVAASDSGGMGAGSNGDLAEVVGAWVTVVAVCVDFAAAGDGLVFAEEEVKVTDILGAGVIVVAVLRGRSQAEFGVRRVVAIVINTFIQSLNLIVIAIGVEQAAFSAAREGVVACFECAAGVEGTVIDGAGVDVFAVGVADTAIWFEGRGNMAASVINARIIGAEIAVIAP